MIENHIWRQKKNIWWLKMTFDDRKSYLKTENEIWWQIIRSDDRTSRHIIFTKYTADAFRNFSCYAHHGGVGSEVWHFPRLILESIQIKYDQWSRVEVVVGICLPIMGKYLEHYLLLSSAKTELGNRFNYHKFNNCYFSEIFNILTKIHIHWPALNHI